MTAVLMATDTGCRTFTDAGEGDVELAGRQISAVATGVDGVCLAVVDEREIWRRSVQRVWSKVTTTPVPLQAIMSVDGVIFAGGRDEAVVVRVSASGEAERMKGFDAVPGRSEWFAGGPPLGVRALAAAADGSSVLAAVHVGGIPRSQDGGETWMPTLPIKWDAHDVRAHPSLPHIVAAAAAAGLCISHDGGRNWSVFADGLELTYSLAVAVLEDEVLFSSQDGPFAKRSQVWRWRIGGKRIEQVRDGLPEWLEGKVDTAKIAAGGGRAALVDQGGTLWLSGAGSTGWKRIATGLPYVFGLLLP